MKNKNGFTFVELLAIIGIIGVIITVVVIAVVALMNRTRDSIGNQQEKQVLEAAAVYAADRAPAIAVCKTSDKSDCEYDDVTIWELIEGHYFENKGDKCKIDVIIYIYVNDNNSYTTEFAPGYSEEICDK